MANKNPLIQPIRAEQGRDANSKEEADYFLGPSQKTITKPTSPSSIQICCQQKLKSKKCVQPTLLKPIIRIRLNSIKAIPSSLRFIAESSLTSLFFLSIAERLIQSNHKQMCKRKTKRKSPTTQYYRTVVGFLIAYWLSIK